MKWLSVFLLFCCLLTAQQTLKFIGKYSDGQSSYNDIWGFKKKGKDYILMGKANKYGVIMYEIQPDGTAREHLNYTGEEHNGSWSEPRYYAANNKEYVYIPTDKPRSSDGLAPTIIIDVTNPNEIKKVGEFGEKSHNIFLYKNYLFTCGSNDLGSKRSGVECWDLTNPEKPTLKWSYKKHYVHDLWISDDRMYLAEMYNSSFSVYDIAKVTDPEISEDKLIFRHSYPGGFTHHLNPTKDHKYLVVVDEHNKNDHIQLWDIQDPNNIQNLWKHQEGTTSIVHNSFIKENILHLSYYDRGYMAFDISDKSNIKKIAEYDTFPEGQEHSQGSYKGAWGVYPFLENNYVAVSDRTHGMHMFQLNTEAGSTFEDFTLTPIYSTINGTLGYVDVYISFKINIGTQVSLSDNINQHTLKLLDQKTNTFTVRLYSNAQNSSSYTLSYNSKNIQIPVEFKETFKSETNK